MEEENKKETKSKKTKEIDELKEVNKSLEEEVLRAKADLINYRKRKDEEVSSILKYSSGDLLLQIIEVIDSFERALSVNEDNLSDEMKNYLSGFKMLYDSLKNILNSNGVKEIECLGKKFDSKYEASLFTASDSTKDDEIVLEVLQKGYTYYDKVLRHASVKINKIENNENMKGND